MESISTPKKLGRSGRKFWHDIVGSGTYQLNEVELRTLESACREIDIIDQIQTELDSDGLWAEGSTGQRIASPMLQEIRHHRALLNVLMKALALPDEDTSTQSVAPTTATKARAGGFARWEKSRGA